jgi:hypothetical protein
LESSTTKVATADTDGAGDRSHPRAAVPKTRRGKSAKGTDSAAASNKLATPVWGTRRAQKELRKSKSR